MPKLTIDGKAIEVPPGHQPHRGGPPGRRRGPALLLPPRPLHRRASAACAWSTSRRRPRPTIACNTQAADGMVVHTDTERVQETRRSMMEFHLINHPLDCPVCDQAGECWLQIYYMKHGLYDPRMTDEKVHKPKAVPLGPHVMLDAERCILCSRCVRFCDEVTKTGRARHLQPRRPLRDRPVPGPGPRQQLLRQRRRHLPGGRAHRPRLPLPGPRLVPRHGQVGLPGLRARLQHRGPHQPAAPPPREGRRVARLKPRFNADVNKWWICDEGRYGFRFVDDENRLTYAPSRGGPASTSNSPSSAQPERRHSLQSTPSLRWPRPCGAIAPGEIAVIASPQHGQRGPVRAAVARRASRASARWASGVPPARARRRGRPPHPRRQAPEHPGRRADRARGDVAEHPRRRAAAGAVQAACGSSSTTSLASGLAPARRGARPSTRVETLIFAGTNANAHQRRAPTSCCRARPGWSARARSRTSRAACSASARPSSRSARRWPDWDVLGRVLGELGAPRRRHPGRAVVPGSRRARSPAFAGMSYQASATAASCVRARRPVAVPGGARPA